LDWIGPGFSGNFMDRIGSMSWWIGLDWVRKNGPMSNSVLTVCFLAEWSSSFFGQCSVLLCNEGLPTGCSENEAYTILSIQLY